ncbi:MAG TPA: ester cyclase [Gemmatimonadales bacterium]
MRLISYWLALPLLWGCTVKGSQAEAPEAGGSSARAIPATAPADSPGTAAVRSPEYLKTLVRGYYEEVLTRRHSRLRDSYLAPNYVGHFSGVTGDLSRETWTLWLNELRQALPDASFTIDDMMVEGNRVTTRYTMQGTHTGPLRWMPPTGRRIAVSGISVERIEGEQIAESWNHSDALRLWQQVGAVSDPVGPTTQYEHTPLRFASPELFKDVPERVRAKLQSRGCRIPQWLGDTVPSNIVKGRFTAAGSEDWAALCTRVRTDILVFRQDTEVDSLPGIIDNALGVAGPDFIIQHLEWYGVDDDKPASLEGKGDSLRKVIIHDGIESSDNHCCSTVHYWDGRRWVVYPGAD